MSARDRRHRPRRVVRVLVSVLLLGMLGLVAFGAFRLVGAVQGWLGGDRTCTLRAGETEEVLTVEQAANAATIAQVALSRDLSPRAVTIAIATVIQESGLRNLDYGDRDSLGLFQQRPSQEWGTREEVRDPVYASNAFYDVLLTLPDWEITGSVNDLAQAVQRSGFPDAYADHEGEARVIASVLVGQPGAALGLACRVEAEDGGLPVVTTSDVEGRIERQLGLAYREGPMSVGRPSILIDAGSSERAASVAVWALAHAPYAGLDEVQVGDRRWRVGEDVDLPWSAAEEAIGEAEVRIVLHR